MTTLYQYPGYLTTRVLNYISTKAGAVPQWPAPLRPLRCSSDPGTHGASSGSCLGARSLWWKGILFPSEWHSQKGENNFTSGKGRLNLMPKEGLGLGLGVLVIRWVCFGLPRIEFPSEVECSITVRALNDALTTYSAFEDVDFPVPVRKVCEITTQSTSVNSPVSSTVCTVSSTQTSTASITGTSSITTSISTTQTTVASTVATRVRRHIDVLECSTRGASRESHNHAVAPGSSARPVLRNTLYAAR